MKPRLATPKSPITERVVYPDADGRSGIIADVAFDPSIFTLDRETDSIWILETGFRWKSSFAEARNIYGIELLESLALLMQEGND